jgi:hypothetical protein
MKDFGYRPVMVQFLGGVEVVLMARYWCRSQARAEKGKGSYFGLVLLGVCDRTTPALASEVAQLAAALSSFDDAQARLRQMGVVMSIRRIASVAYHFAQRARSRQELEGMGIKGSLAGKRVVISSDGGRLRVRRNKRGKRTKKGRLRYRTDWREPKLLVIYVVDEKGRIAQEFAPVMDGTLRGPDEVFRRNRSQPGDWLVFRPFRGEKCACPPRRRRGQSHFRGVRRENRDSPRERLRARRSCLPRDAYFSRILSIDSPRSEVQGRAATVIAHGPLWDLSISVLNLPV